MENDRFFVDAIAERKALIEKLQKEVADLEFSRANGPSIIATARDEIVSCKRRLKRLHKHREVERIRSLMAEMDKLQEETGLRLCPNKSGVLCHRDTCIGDRCDEMPVLRK